MPVQGVGIARRRLEPQLLREPMRQAAGMSLSDEVAVLRMDLERLLEYVRLVDDQLSREVTEPSPARKETVTGVVPSATVDTFGADTDIEPTTGYSALQLVHVALTSGGTFGAETLTVRVTAHQSDGTTTSVEKTFAATGLETALTNAELHDLLKEACSIVKLAIAAKSNIASSTATAGAKVAAGND